jgi:hypothetical protein
MSGTTAGRRTRLMSSPFDWTPQASIGKRRTCGLTLWIRPGNLRTGAGVTAPATLRAPIRAIELQGEPVSTETPAPAPFFRLEFTAREDEAVGPTFTQYYVPFREVVAIQTDPAATACVRAGALNSLYERVTAGVTPFGKPTFTRAALGGLSVGAAPRRARQCRPPARSRVPRSPPAGRAGTGHRPDRAARVT